MMACITTSTKADTIAPALAGSVLSACKAFLESTAAITGARLPPHTRTIPSLASIHRLLPATAHAPAWTGARPPPPLPPA